MAELLLIFVVIYGVKLLVIPAVNLQLRPLVLGLLMGLLFGDLQNGIVFGAFIEMIYLGLFGVGGAPPLDAEFAGIIGVGAALATDQEMYVAVLIGLIASAVGLFAYTKVIKPFNLRIATRCRQLVEGEQFKQFEHLHLLGTFTVPLIYSLFGLLIYYLSVTFLITWLTKLPAEGTMFLQIFCMLLPLVSLAGLVQHELTKETLPFLILGFGMAAYLASNAMAVLIIAGVLCYAINYLIPKNDKPAIKSGVTEEGGAIEDDEDDFF